MGDRQRRTGRLENLTTKSRVSKETKLRLRVVYLDDSERTFEVEVSPSQGAVKTFIFTFLSGSTYSTCLSSKQYYK